MARKRILSVDFDYFYPDATLYDWGHSEHHSPLMATVLWQTRCGSHNLITGEEALESYVPSVPADFWESVLLNKPPVYVSDSHLNIWERLSEFGNATITSVDAHHDCGYSEINPMLDKFSVDCGNWGLIGKMTARITEVHLHYPQWRDGNQETQTDTASLYALPSSISYSLPDPAEYDEVFVCRSGAWTPPWFDDVFVAFVESLGLETVDLDDVWEKRSPTMSEARSFAQEWKKMLASIQPNKEG